VVEWIDALFNRFRILMDDQLHPGFLCRPVTQLVHILELPGSIDMEQWEWRRTGEKGQLRQMQHHR
jgi:hypothetical protein